MQIVRKASLPRGGRLTPGFRRSGVTVALPVNSVAPVISGTATVGQTLSSTTGTWSGTGTLSYAYQWKRDGVNISGATSATYLLDALDEATNITCRVTATDDNGSASATSNSLGPIDAASPLLATYDFTGGSLPSGMSFTRASTGTYVNSSGVVTSAAVDTPRFDYDPTALTLLGMLVEDSRTNIVPNSANLTGTTKNIATVTVDGPTSPMGAASNKILATAAAGRVFASYNNIFTADGVRRRFSLFAKAGTYNLIGLTTNSNNFNLLVVDLSDGSTPYIGASPYIDTGSVIVTPYPDGWYQISLTSALNNTNYDNFTVMLPPNATTPDAIWTPAGTETIYVAGEQVTLRATGEPVGSHIPTAGSSVTRAADAPLITDNHGTADVQVTFDDASTQDFLSQTVTGAYFPSGLNRLHVKTIDVYTGGAL